MVARRERELLTSDEKVLLHLLNFVDMIEEGRAPFAITQQGIADATGLQRSHIPRIARRLEEKDYISAATRYVQGSARRRKVYTLTQKGAVAARAIFNSFMDEEVIVVTAAGDKKVPVSEIPSVIGGNISYFTVLKNIRNGRFVLEKKGLVYFSDFDYVPNHFFGRERELDELKEWLKKDGGIFIIQGIAGIGKSTLLHMAIQDFRGEKNIFWHSIYEWDDVSNLLRLLSDFFSDGGVNMLSAYIKRQKNPSLAEVSLSIRDSVRKMGPTVLIFDDSQNATGDVQNLIRLIAMITGQAEHLHLVLLSREPFNLYRDSDGNIDTGSLREMRLSGLDPVAAGEILRERNISREFWRDIIKKSGAHPLALKMLSPSSDLSEIGDVEDFIKKELFSDMDAEEQELLSRISIFRNGAIPSALHLNMEGMEHINNLLARGLLSVLDGKYRMHQLIRNFILSKMDQDKKKRLHSVAASFFLSEALPEPEHVVEAIYHHIMAENYYHAAHIIARFGPRLINDGFSEQLLEFMDMLPENDRSIMPPHIERRIIDMKAEIYLLKGQYDRALSLYAREIELSASPSPLTFYHMAEILYLQGKSDESLYYLNMGLKKIARDDYTLLPKFELLFGRVFSRSGEYEEALKILNRSLRGFVSQGDMKSMTEAFQYIATIYFEKGEYQHAEEFYRLSLNIATELHDSYMMARSYHNIAAVYHDSGRLSMAEEYFQRAFEIWKDMGAARESAWAIFNICEVYIDQGMIGAAAVLLDQTEETLSFIGDRRGLSSVLKYRGRIYALQGRRKEAVESFEKALSLLAGLNMPQVEAIVKGEYGIALLVLGDERGDELVSEAVEDLRKLGIEAVTDKLIKRAGEVRNSD